MEEFIEVETTTSILLKDQELQDSEPFFHFSSSISTITRDGHSQKINSKNSDNEAKFIKNMEYWNQETALLSIGNFNNSYFKEIVNMGIDAVPFIIAELQKGPTPLVHALDLIFPGVMKYEGFVSLKDACNKWLLILKKTV